MAKLIFIIAFATQILLLLAVVISTAENGDNFAKTMNRKLFGLRKEKLTYLRVYWHDILSGTNPTAVEIHPPLSRASLFTSVTVMDNRLTTEVSLNSTSVGQAQGIYAFTGQSDPSALMVMNFVFKTGKYNGSTISILGKNAVLTKVREMPIVGGSGVFRFARGYVEARTKMFDRKLRNAIVEYTCYVLHY